MTQHTHKFVNGVQVNLTLEEIAEIEAREAEWLAGADIRKAVKVREQRNEKLVATDWTQAADVPQSIKDNYASYRQALRDVPQQSGFPNQVVWPTQE
jgi:hypothetical protein